MAAAAKSAVKLQKESMMQEVVSVDEQELHYIAIFRPSSDAKKKGDDGDAALTLHLMRKKEGAEDSDITSAQGIVHMKDPPADEVVWFAQEEPFKHLDMTSAVLAYRRDVADADRKGDVPKPRDAYSGVCSGSRKGMFELAQRRLDAFNAVQKDRDANWEAITMEPYNENEGINGANYRCKVDTKDLLKIDIAGSGSALLLSVSTTLSLVPKKKAKGTTLDNITTLSGMPMRLSLKLKRPTMSWSVDQVDMGSFSVDSGLNDARQLLSKDDAIALVELYGADPSKPGSKTVIEALQKGGADITEEGVAQLVKFIAKCSKLNNELVVREADRSEILGVLQGLSNKAAVADTVSASGDADAEPASADPAAKKARVE